MIVERSKKKEEVMLLRSFKEWKRIDYQIILDNLKMYSASLNSKKKKKAPSLVAAAGGGFGAADKRNRYYGC